MSQKNKYVQIEEDLISFWKDNKIFDSSISQRDENRPYAFYDGPPFATGMPHYGHILSSVIKDLIPRYYTMKGMRVRRRWGWDCHGLPIETLVEKKLEISGKKQIEQKGIDIFNQTARSMVLEYASSWNTMVDRVGRWVEFDDSYKTMDTTFMESVWWALKTLWDKDLIYEGRKVLMYCPRCETPVSNAEIQMDNSYKDVEEESVYVKFKLKSGQKFKDYETQDSAYMLAWTTTPWTLPANVALAVGGDIDYSAVRIKGQEGLYILASAMVEKVFNGQKVETVHNDLKGSDLEGIFYEPLYEIPAIVDSGNKAWYVATADFVSTEEGTGVVHTAVIYGEDDYELGLNLDLPQVPLLDSTARYNQEAPEFLRGKYIKDAEPEIMSDLETRDLLFKKEKYTHSYPFCWRCESPLIYNAISAWFIDIQKNKKDLIHQNEKINWYPGNLKHGRFLNILETAPDWNISRNRYWATPLPFWKCGKCNKSICVGSVGDLREQARNFDEVYPDFGGEEIISNDSKIDLHKPYIDRIEINCECGGIMRRTDEVVDCWVESSSMPFAEWHYPFENKAVFEARYPGQFIGEYIAQTRAWFYYMHVIGVLIFDKISFENVVATGTILNEKGEKLSKSKNNFTDPNIIIDQYGADALRFYLMNSVVMQADNLFFNEKDLRDVYNKVINLFHNIIKFYEIYNENQIVDDLKLQDERLNILDRWILSRLSSTINTVADNLDQYNTVKSSRAIKHFIDDLSTWWLRRSRDRFKQDKLALQVLKFTILNLARIMAPFTPFIAEYAFSKVRKDSDSISVHLELFPDPKDLIYDPELEGEMALARKIVELGHSLRNENSVRVRQPLGGIYWSSNFKEGSLKKIILEELNVLEFRNKELCKDPKDIKEGELEVVLDIALDETLREMGDVREAVRAIQDLRKKSGRRAGEKLQLLYSSESKNVLEMINKNKNKIADSTDLSSISEDEKLLPDSSGKVDLSSGSALIAISESSKT